MSLTFDIAYGFLPTYALLAAAAKEGVTDDFDIEPSLRRTSYNSHVGTDFDEDEAVDLHWRWFFACCENSQMLDSHKRFFAAYRALGPRGCWNVVRFPAIEEMQQMQDELTAWVAEGSHQP